jgi:hypothetical protein
VALSLIPELTRAVGVPRLLGVGHPMGQPFGQPHDVARQRAVLLASLDLLENATGAGAYAEMPGEWPETVAQARNASRDIPHAPIVGLLQRKPWLVPLLYLGRIPRPDEQQAAEAEHAAVGEQASDRTAD